MSCRPLGLPLTTALSLLGACIQPGPVVILDHRTALEAQAAGRYPSLEAELEQAALSPGPEPFTKGQLPEVGPDDRSWDRLVQIYRAVGADAEEVDRLLRLRCLGEGLEGTLHVSAETCLVEVDAARVRDTAARQNRRRRELWSYLAAQRPGKDTDSARRAWRRRHLQAVVCEGWIETDRGTWAAKDCER